MAFMRRAVAEDKNLQIVTLQRLAKDQFRRFSVDDSLDLVAGFPKTRDELFTYKGIILGSMEASWFTGDQLRMLADFVSERGGGLLALGGRRSLGEGGFAGTPVAEVLPVDLGGGPNDKAGYLNELKVDVTVPGSMHAATQIAEAESTSAKRWKTMPPVTSVNRIGRARPGATVLLTGASSKGGDREIVLAYQRVWARQGHRVPDSGFLGLADAERPRRRDVRVVLAPAVAVARERRALACHGGGRGRSGSSGRSRRAQRGNLGPHVPQGEQRRSRCTCDFAVRKRLRDAARVVGNAGRQVQGVVHANGEGLYRVDVRNADGNRFDRERPVVHRVRADLSTEYFGAGCGPAAHGASRTRPEAASTRATRWARLAKDIVFTDVGNTVVDRKDLWDMPIGFLLLIALVTSEWGYRKLRGLA
jgi:hypothetical protein